MKTTWFPAYLFVLVILPVVVYSIWDRNAMTLMGASSTFHIVDYLTVLPVLPDAVLSGWTIQKLRLGGYKMF